MNTREIAFAMGMQKAAGAYGGVDVPWHTRHGVRRAMSVAASGLALVGLSGLGAAVALRKRREQQRSITEAV